MIMLGSHVSSDDGFPSSWTMFLEGRAQHNLNQRAMRRDPPHRGRVFSIVRPSPRIVALQAESSFR
jgi:hypothetical protein